MKPKCIWNGFLASNDSPIMTCKTFTVLSLGAGVQSSCIALMAACGEITPMPDAAIFADTQVEPQDVYDYLEYLKPLLPFPVHVVTHGNLEQDFLSALSDPKGRCGQPPFFVRNEEKNAEAMLWRQCTKEYKLDVIRRMVRELAGPSIARWKRDLKTHGFAMNPYVPVLQWIGISLDEAHRMKDSRAKYIKNVYPLIERRKSRHDCLSWLKKNGFREPPKSACRFCPYIDDARLRDMRDNKPAEWSKLVAFDHEMRRRQRAVNNGARITGTLYVHRSCKPIDEVDLSTEEDRGQMNMFANECEGMCGV